MKDLISALLCSLLMCSVSTAQDAKATDVIEQPNATNSVLRRFVGKWNTVSTAVTAGGIAPAAYTGTMEGRMLGKIWLINEYEAVIGGMPFNAIQRLGFDKEKQRYIGTWADSFITYEWPLKGEANGNQLVITSSGPNPSNPSETSHFRDTYEFISADLIAGTSQLQGEDKSWSTFITSEFRRAEITTQPNPKTQIIPFLMFDGQAEEAMKLYTSLFPDAKIGSVKKYGAGEDGKEGSIKTAKFDLSGQQVMCIDSPTTHEFTFTPSFSFFVECESENQLDDLFKKLSKDGKVMMPAESYGFSRKFCWTSDRFGVSWQLNLANE